MSGWPDGYALVVRATVDSTMAEAARLADPAQGALWVFATEQTAARGRRGRAWRHPVGNFSATVVIWPGTSPGQAALRSFVMALALNEALAALTRAEAALALKWPNDVLLMGGKCAGILLETLPQGGLAIGVGVNLIAAPAPEAVEPGAVRPVSVLAETGVRLTPEAMLEALAARFAVWEARLRAEGFAPVREAWLARAARLGQPVEARLPNATYRGVFDTVDDHGAIVLNTDTGRVAIAAADIHF